MRTEAPPRPESQAPPPRARGDHPDDTTYAEDLERDRHFERSLITREIAVVLLIILLILIRQFFS